MKDSSAAILGGEGFGVAWMVFVVRPLGARAGAACAFAQATMWPQDGAGDLS